MRTWFLTIAGLSLVLVFQAASIFIKFHMKLTLKHLTKALLLYIFTI